MRLTWKLLAALACSALLNGCLYVDATYPLDTNMDKTPAAAKVGEASRYSVLWMVAWGDGGTQAAARNGGLSVIHNADTHDKVVLFGLYARRTTIVYGE